MAERRRVNRRRIRCIYDLPPLPTARPTTVTHTSTSSVYLHRRESSTGLSPSAASVSLRDQHMPLLRDMALTSSGAKAVVWTTPLVKITQVGGVRWGGKAGEHANAGGVPTRHTHKWDGLNTRHLLESTHTNTHKHKQITN